MEMFLRDSLFKTVQYCIGPVCIDGVDGLAIPGVEFGIRDPTDFTRAFVYQSQMNNGLSNTFHTVIDAIELPSHFPAL
jgi:hypothetical protein